MLASPPKTGQKGRSLLACHDQRLLEQLVQQQFWLFGADIRRPAGNLLLELGFERHRAPDPIQGSSCYVAPQSGADVVHLWGFGCCLTSVEDGRIFLSRHKSLARRMSAEIALERLHSVPQVHRLCHLDADAALPMQQATLLRWFADYERHVQDRTGLDERAATLAPLAHRRVCEAGDLPVLWEYLATALRQTAERAALPDGTPAPHLA